MLNLDPGKLLVIAVVAIIVLGPDKLPHFARQVGGTWRSFNDFRQRMENEVRGTIPDLPSTSDIARIARNPTALLQHLENMSPADGDVVPATDDRPETMASPGVTAVEPAMSWVTRDYGAELSGPHEGEPAHTPAYAGDATLN